MAFCKVCACGKKIFADKRQDFPDRCPSCNRRIVTVEIYNDDDPRLNDHNDDIPSAVETCRKKYVLKLNNGGKIEIPEGGGIIGRTGIGAEELAEFPSVSRQHLKITIKRNIGAIAEDISTYGTLVDGHKIEKNSPVIVADGSKITLCNLETIFTAEEADSQ